MNSVLCIDLGSTNIKLHINNGKQDFYEIQPSGRDISIDTFKEYVNNFLKSAKVDKVAGVAVSFPGVAENGRVVNSLVDILNHVGDDFLLSLSRNVVYINDANAVAYYIAKENPEYKSIATLTVGTNIGFAMMDNGKLFEGANKNAGEHSYYTLAPNGEFCPLNLMCSGRTIQNMLDSGLSLDIALNQTAKYLVCLITQVYNLYDPDVVFLSGGAFNYDGFFEIVESYLAPLSTCKIKLAPNPVYAGCFGAKEYFNIHYKNK